MIRLVLLALLLTASAAAQTPDALGAALVVETDGGAVYVTPADGAARGPFAPGAVVALPAGAATVVALSDAAAWDAPRAEATVALTAGDTTRVRLVLPVRYRVETLPLGAAVTLESPGAAPRALGAAPLAVDLPVGATGTVTARLDGYADARAALDGTGGPVALVLRPGDAVEGVVPVVLLPTQRSPRTRTLIDVGIGALALAAGAVAVHYKFQADRIDDRYRNPDSPDRGSEALRLEAERLDVRSGIALGTMQVGVGVLALRFILR